MTNVISLDEIRTSKNKEETTEIGETMEQVNFQEAEYVKIDDVEFATSTEVLNQAVTLHNQRIAALKPNQRIVLKSVNVLPGNVTVLNGEIQEAPRN